MIDRVPFLLTDERVSHGIALRRECVAALGLQGFQRAYACQRLRASAAASAADDGGDGGGGDGDGGLVKVIGKDHAHVAPLVEMLVLLEGVTLEDGDGG